MRVFVKHKKVSLICTALFVLLVASSRHFGRSNSKDPNKSGGNITREDTLQNGEETGKNNAFVPGKVQFMNATRQAGAEHHKFAHNGTRQVKGSPQGNGKSSSFVGPPTEVINLSDLYIRHMRQLEEEKPERKNKLEIEEKTQEGGNDNVVKQVNMQEISKKTLSQQNSRTRNVTVALGLGFISRTTGILTEEPSELFNTLISSFCKTATPGYIYKFYLGIDYDDQLITMEDRMASFKQLFQKYIQGQGEHSYCHNLTHVDLNIVNCSHTGKPAWAQNDAMMAAYMDGADYFYRINDDTLMTTEGWTETFISRLSEYDPPNVGVVGPAHSGGNTYILTYDFVHRSHMDVFGFYYPRDFPDWYADEWITGVYEPDRMTKMKDVHLVHKRVDRRYKIHRQNRQRISDVVVLGKQRLTRFIESRQKPQYNDSRQVIAMPLAGDDAAAAFGVIRHIMDQPIFFPKWSIRVYLEKPPVGGSAQTRFSPVPSNVVSRLKDLSVQLVHVDTRNITCHHSLWPVLSLDDTSVDYLLVRKPSSRQSYRDAVVVDDWMKSDKAIHVIKDHSKHKSSHVIPGLWGANTDRLRTLSGGDIMGFLTSSQNFTGDTTTFLNRSQNETHFLNEVLLPKMDLHILCHDSIDSRKPCVPIPAIRANGEYLGQEFGPNGENLDDKTIMPKQQ